MMDTIISNTGDGNIINTGEGVTIGRGDVDTTVSILQGDGTRQNISNEGDVLLGRTEVGQEPSQENTQIQTPKSRRGQREVTPEDKEIAIKLAVEDSLKNNLLAINGLDIKKKYPKGYKALATYMGDKAQIPNMMDEETVLGILLYSPRIVLYDFFDLNEIYTNILGLKQSWYVNIDSLKIKHTTPTFSSRVEAEVAGFDKAFEILEKDLTP